MLTGKLIGAFVSLVVGGVLAGVTLVGLVTNTVNSSSDNPGDLNAAIPYGTTQ